MNEKEHKELCIDAWSDPNSMKVLADYALENNLIDMRWFDYCNIKPYYFHELEKELRLYIQKKLKLNYLNIRREPFWAPGFLNLSNRYILSEESNPYFRFWTCFTAYANEKDTIQNPYGLGMVPYLQEFGITPIDFNRIENEFNQIKYGETCLTQLISKMRSYAFSQRWDL